MRNRRPSEKTSIARDNFQNAPIGKPFACGVIVSSLMATWILSRDSAHRTDQAVLSRIVLEWLDVVNRSKCLRCKFENGRFDAVSACSARASSRMALQGFYRPGCDEVEGCQLLDRIVCVNIYSYGYCTLDPCSRKV